MSSESKVKVQEREPELTDEQILEFEQKIKDEEALKVIELCRRVSCRPARKMNYNTSSRSHSSAKLSQYLN